MPEPPAALARLAQSMGVATHYRDGLGRNVEVSTDTLVATCAALGAPVAAAGDAAAALRLRREEAAGEVVPPVLLAWEGRLDVAVGQKRPDRVEIVLEDGGVRAPEWTPTGFVLLAPLPFGYHRLRVESGGRSATGTVIAAPKKSWRRPDVGPRWGVGAQLAALRSRRSRSVGDLADLTTLCDWVGDRGGALVNLLPLLPTFNDPPVEPSPYSPVSRLFWSELTLDLGAGHTPVPRPSLIDVGRADVEVRVGLADIAPPAPPAIDAELARYAAFRGAQRRIGREWRSWPEAPRRGHLRPEDVDPDEERFHLTAQSEIRRQVSALRHHLDTTGVQLGLDLAVGVHPHGYDVWSRPELFAVGMSVGAPPDAGFPSGQSWGFPPMLPAASRAEGHSYFASGVAHQAALADVLRIDHIMAMKRLYWIPDGMGLGDGTYVDYPLEELFAVLCLESHRHRCELVGENLGTVPPEIDTALEQHAIWGMYLAEFEASATGTLTGPSDNDVAMIGTHDTPLFAGWLDAVDIDERVELGLLEPEAAVAERDHRIATRAEVTTALGATSDDPAELLTLLLTLLGKSASPLVVIWLEDLWLERGAVNIPGSGSAERPNWARPMAMPLDDALSDKSVTQRIADLQAARA